ncbi:hypothetical protein H072_11250 [Dactylellina haptotyla CBS 200.50]|uniref:F-box domain-containing protein n=1 Tax=Dactylellina haptotyla (strain CBS 200.50) TaxID=1284197 RepID=S8A2J9_DACHA|nr:hypothetical protein H072_11250 [Dactylellina haptotyla CBS 200.50]
MLEATIYSLPPEIIHQLGSYLDQDDLLAFRMTCKEINVKAREVHLTSIFECRRLLFAPASFDNLRKVSQHPSGVNLKVKDIIISCTTPYHEFPGDFVEGIRANVNGKYDGLQTMLLEIHDNSLVHLPEVFKMQEDQQETSLLTEIFRNLPNIRSIRIKRDDKSPFSRAEMNLYYPKLNMVPGTRLPEQVGGSGIYGGYLAYPEAVTFWNIPLNAAMSARLKRLETITDDLDITIEGLPLSWFAAESVKLHGFGTCFPLLKTLKTVVNDNPGEAVATNMIFCDCLESLTRLEHLDLKRNSSVEIDRLTNFLPTKVGLPMLKRLLLENVVLKWDNLRMFLDFCKTNITYIRLLRCSLEHPAEDWFQAIKYIRKELVNLQTAILDPVFAAGSKVNAQSEKYVLPWMRLIRFSMPLYGGRGWHPDSETDFKVIVRSKIEKWSTYYPLVKNLASVLKSTNVTAEEFWSLLAEKRWRLIPSGQ